MSSHILPVTYPTIQTWTWQSGLFAILETENLGYNWLYSNFIQIVADRYDNTCNVDFIPGYDCFNFCPQLFVQHIRREFIEGSCNGSLLEIFKNFIDMNNYIYGIFDESKMTRINFNHELFIYGYDDSKQVFHVADFTFKNKYSFETIPYETLINAYEAVSKEADYLYENKGGLLLISIDKNGKYEFDAWLVYQTLIEYINGVRSKDKFRLFRNPKKNESFGLQAYDTVSQFYTDVLNENNENNIKPLHFMASHKIFMLKRIQYMIENDYLHIDETLLQRYIEIKNKIMILRNIALKANYKRDELFEKIPNALQEIKRLENDVLIEIIDKIKIKDISQNHWR